MNIQHQNLTNGRWTAMSLAEQMANIGSEVGRTFIRRVKREPEGFEFAFTRALELFDLTLSDKRWGFAKLKEIARAREFFCGLCQDQNNSPASEDYLNNYFLSFAVLSRSNR
jgi:hypothetical protein